MTDKPIIINDIDVSECEYYDKNRPLLTCVCDEYPCSECPNCYYKQLKRSEAQCEGMFVSHTDLEKKYRAKEQECEKLKETFDGLLKIQYKLADNCKKLRQTLTDIKEITEPWYTLGSKDSPVAQILQKISEVEE